ncbi:putative bifunctional diguanylate cyclase/phosphodiesterase [Geodermatophilus ruber]|uniref:PAS domain S-box-containing protein/diguanylate cyclase (GGDEF) domain-containing protein n=1 Tax=Geodermatophilus ruber TaxID=504800 RepID=A0A1I4I7D7_9ACTN|nr:GGDEF domain-containing phosphodiesterase [Geodermatophilus ruber]SFL50302.1 PAS domain S-box-containing protein/diguanylate cyclase (GGDEF) domain-containing protein [Geodermatophilus ruber]
MPVGAACAVSAGTGARVVGDVAVAALGVVTAVVIWCAGRSRQSGLRGWRLFAIGPLLPVIGFTASTVVGITDPMQLVVLRWLPTVPAYVIAVAGILTLVDRTRLLRGARAAVELALFGTACLLVVQLLVLGPHRSWLDLAPGEVLILGAAVVVTSATMTAALVVLGVIESHRQRMALVLLAGAILLTTGRALATSALLSGAVGVTDLSRFMIVAGLVLFGAAVLLDPGPCEDDGARPRPDSGRSTQLGQLLPHLAMVVALLGAAVAALVAGRPSPVLLAGLLLCAVLAAVHRWVTARGEQHLGARLRRSEAYFRSMVRSSGDAVLILDGDLRVTWAGATLAAALGDTADAVPGRHLIELVHPDDALPVAGALQPGPDGDPSAGLLRLRLRHADGTWRHLEASVSDLRRDADVGAVVLHCRDVTARLARERVLEQLAFTDPLTGLPNWAGLARRVEEALAAPAERGAPGRSLLLVELDGLDEVREHAGRDVMNTVLVELGRRLRATVRGSEAVARLGGGAFAVLAESAGHTAGLLADRCLSAIEQPLATGAGIFDLTASVGVVDLEAGLTVNELLARAELAVRAAERSGPGTSQQYRPALGNAAVRRARLRDDLPYAVARGELAVLFQPIVSLEEQRVTGVEALLRWRHPELGDVPPAEFVPIAERAGVIGELQRWALERAAEAAVALPSTNGVPLRLGVNISASHVAARTLVGDVAAVLRSTGLAPERLVLEITEATVLADGEYVAVDFEALRLMGVHVALDDFGTGHFSLAHLTRLPIDILKLDESFVTRVDRDPKTRALCESVVTIGRTLGLDVVAEGVETPAQLGALRTLGCGFAQGFLLARPMRQEELGALLADGAGVLWPGLVGTR